MPPVPRSIPRRFSLAALVLSLTTPLTAQVLTTPAALPFAGPGWEWTSPRDLTAPEIVPSMFSVRSAASSGSEILLVYQSYERIVGVRIASDGALVDTPPIVFGSEPMRWPRSYDHSAPRVAWNGERYLVIWRENSYRIRGQFASRDGGFLGPPFTIPGNASWYDLASNGDTFLLAAQVTSGGPVEATLISPDGAFQAVPIAIHGFSAVASDGEDYLLLSRALYEAVSSAAIRISRSGQVLTNIPLAPAAWADLAWSGTYYLAMPSGRKELQRLDRDGRPVGSPIPVPLEQSQILAGSIAPLGPDRALIAISTNDENLGNSDARLARLDGGSVTVGEPLNLISSGWMLARAHESTIFFSDRPARRATVDEASLSIAPAGGELAAASAPDQTEVRTAITTAGVFAVWKEIRGFAWALEASIVSPAGIPGPQFPVAALHSTDPAPAVASSGAVVLVAWFDDNQGRGLWGRRFTAAGHPLDAEPVRLFGPDGYHVWGSRPALSWNGETFIVAWPGREGIRVARVTIDGLVLDPGGVEIPAMRPSAWPKRWPALASSGSTTLLVWQEGEVTRSCQILCEMFPEPELFALRLDRNLSFLDPAPFELAPGAFLSNPSVAANGDTFCVAAVKPRGGAEARRVALDGRIVDTSPLQDFFGLDDEIWEVDALLDAQGVAVEAAPGGIVLLASTTGRYPYRDAITAQNDHLRFAFVPLDGPPRSPFASRGTWISLPGPDLSIFDDGTMLVFYSGWREDVGITRRAALQMLRPLAPPRRRTVIR